LFKRFYGSIADPQTPAEYPEMSDGLRQMAIMQAELESHRSHGWVNVAD
jgi:hypothetical protein